MYGVVLAYTGFDNHVLTLGWVCGADERLAHQAAGVETKGAVDKGRATCLARVPSQRRTFLVGFEARL